MKQEMETPVEPKTAKERHCESPYHRHRTVAMGAEFDECEQGGEHVFKGIPRQLIGDKMPYYNCVKCSKAAVIMYRCVR